MKELSSLRLLVCLLAQIISGYASTKKNTRALRDELLYILCFCSCYKLKGWLALWLLGFVSNSKGQQKVQKIISCQKIKDIRIKTHSVQPISYFCSTSPPD